MTLGLLNPTQDDTDIEFVTLHALMEHGLGLDYKQIAGYWRSYVHIQVNGGDALWFANKVARENMNRGQIPPQTGSMGQNRYSEGSKGEVKEGGV